MKIYEIKAKRIIQPTKIPGADWVINHYSGCNHGCVYCYARFICRWRKKREKWGEFVDVKINAPELVARESRNKKGRVILCSVSDPYQPIERKYRLTRKVLQNLNSELAVSILTKSSLIIDDIDVFRRFKKIELGLTITTLNEKVRQAFEPFSSSASQRLQALRELKKAGFYTYAFVGPILPYLTELEEIFREVGPYVDILMFEDLNMSPARADIMKVVADHFPHLVERYRSLSVEFWERKVEEIEELSVKYHQKVKIYFKHTGTLRFS